MKQISIQFPKLDEEIIFCTGNNANENIELLDTSDENGLWFHIHNQPSCHVLSSAIPDKIDRKTMQMIVKQGALECKKHSKFASIKNLEIIYTFVKNVEKTKILGSVNATNTKIVIC